MTKRRYPTLKVALPKHSDRDAVRVGLIDVAGKLGYISDYHKTTDRGSIGLLLEAIALGEVVVRKS